MSPRAGSAATGSPGRPSPTNFTQTSHVCEGLFDLSNKSSSTVTGKYDQQEENFSAFRVARKSIDQSTLLQNEACQLSLNITSLLSNEASLSNTEDDTAITPLNLSKKPDIHTGVVHEHLYKNASKMEIQSFIDLQDMPLNLSVKDSYTTVSLKTSFQHSSHDAGTATTPNNENENSEDVYNTMNPNSACDKPSFTAQSTEVQDLRVIDNSDEQKQTAAVALCQLAAYSPSKLRLDNEEQSSQDCSTPCTEPTLSSSDTQDNHRNHKAKGQKRTNQKESAKAQQGSKRVRPNDCSRVFTLRKRTRVS
uniref:Uncharacterized protein n=1 Tax=Chelonoidis abingdonii TaxID=106734 RepID=A0A8C0GSA0_CHEAB